VFEVVNIAVFLKYSIIFYLKEVFFFEFFLFDIVYEYFGERLDEDAFGGSFRRRVFNINGL
jgi:hypothetical protein